MLGMNKRNLLVKFIGKKPWYDHLYKTDLTFQPNQVREMPEHYARKFLHHIDMFQLVEKEQTKKGRKWLAQLWEKLEGQSDARLCGEPYRGYNAECQLRALGRR